MDQGRAQEVKEEESGGYRSKEKNRAGHPSLNAIIIEAKAEGASYADILRRVKMNPKLEKLGKC